MFWSGCEASVFFGIPNHRKVAKVMVNWVDPLSQSTWTAIPGSFCTLFYFLFIAGIPASFGFRLRQSKKYFREGSLSAALNSQKQN